jgi:hypothetical protein
LILREKTAMFDIKAAGIVSIHPVAGSGEA